jgi:hypothetical protein
MFSFVLRFPANMDEGNTPEYRLHTREYQSIKSASGGPAPAGRLGIQYWPPRRPGRGAGPVRYDVK